MDEKLDHIKKPSPDNTALKKAKAAEKKLFEKGYVWMRKEKTSVLVSPDKIESYKQNGYK